MYFIIVPRVSQVDLNSVKEMVGNSFELSYVVFFLKKKIEVNIKQLGQIKNIVVISE